MSDSTFYIKVGDLQPAISYPLLDGNGNPINLSGAQVRFHLATAPSAGITLIDRAAGVVSPGTSGVVQYLWQAGDTAVAGKFFAEWPVSFDGGATWQTIPTADWLIVRVVNRVLALP